MGRAFERRVVVIARGDTRACSDADWRDAIVTLERGEVELEGRYGSRRRFGAGAVLWLAGLGLEAINSVGGEPAVLVAVSRRPMTFDGRDGLSSETREQETETTMTQGATDDRARWTALYVLCASVLMIVLDATIVNVALPSIQRDLHFSQNSLAWVVNAYLISFGGLLLLGGRLGDLLGRRRIFLIGLVIFVCASLLCALANSRGLLIAARFVQGVGGALTSAVVLGMIVTMFPEPREQARAIGVYGFVASAGGSIGLLAGGVLTQAINWHWIFFINLPVGVATVMLARRLVADDPGIGFEKGADVPGAIMATSGLMLGVYTILEGSDVGWGSAQTILLGAVAIALQAAFVVRQGRIANPLMPLRLFRAPNIAGANLVMALLVAGMFSMFFLGALYLQRVLKYDPLEVGLAFLPSTIVMGTLSLRYSERLIMRYGPRSTLLPGMVSIAAGLLLYSRTPVAGDYLRDVMPAVVLIGLGAGISFPALMTLSMSGAPPRDAGLASGLINTTVQAGGAIGLAILATVATGRTNGLRDRGESLASALNSGYHVAYVAGAVLVAFAFVVALRTLSAGAPAEAGAHGEHGAQGPGRVEVSFDG